MDPIGSILRKEMTSVFNFIIEHQILEIYTVNRKRYGSPKINMALKEYGTNISLKRTQRIMRKLGIRSIIIKKYRPTSSKYKVAEKVNVIKRNFSTTSLSNGLAHKKNNWIFYVKIYGYSIDLTGS